MANIFDNKKYFYATIKEYKNKIFLLKLNKIKFV